jgi:hypothetical protein
MLVSINELTQYTGRNPRTITKKLENLQYIDGPKGAHLYDSTVALPLIYAIDNLESARAKQALSQASLNNTRELELRRTRIPIQTARAVMNELFGAMGAILKKAEGEIMTVEKINDLFKKFREIPDKLKWAKR